MKRIGLLLARGEPESAGLRIDYLFGLVVAFCAILFLNGCASQTETPVPTFQPVIVFYAATEVPTAIPSPTLPSTPEAAASSAPKPTSTSAPATTTAVPTATTAPITKSQNASVLIISTPIAPKSSITPTIVATQTTPATISPTIETVEIGTISGLSTTITVISTTLQPTGTITIISITVGISGSVSVISSTIDLFATATPVFIYRPRSPTATPTQVNPGILYPAPSVTMPLEGEFRHAPSPPMVAWNAPPLTGATDYYAVNIHHNQGWNVACYKGHQGLAPDWLPNELPHHGFGVFVVVVRSPIPVSEGAYCSGFSVSPPSTQVNFYWTFK